MGEEDLGGRVGGFPALSKLLHKYFPKDHVIFILENSAKDDSDPVRLGLHISMEIENDANVRFNYT